MSFDLIVIGSGFGGAVVACRAAQAGARVLVLERGRRWSPENYPRNLGDPWLYDPRRPAKKNGWLDLRVFKRMLVAQGAGVGGGSLCYSSVVLRPNRKTFEYGWPADISYDDLQPYYDEVARMLRVRTIPENQRTQRNKLLRESAAKAGHGSLVFDTPLAIAFDEQFDPQQATRESRYSRAYRNEQGRWQGTCLHLGNCDIGCDVQAKNTLDLNYLAQAEDTGADIRPLHLVRCITPQDNGYLVSLQRLVNGSLVPEQHWAPRVVIAAGSLGSTELLLRCRDQYATLPNLSRSLGSRWSANGNVLTPAIYPDASQVQQSIGPTISAGLDFDATIAKGFVIEDDGFPDMLRNALRDATDGGWLSALAWSLSGFEGSASQNAAASKPNPLAHVMIWLGAGLDAGDGRLSLKRKWYAPWKRCLDLAWSVDSGMPIVTEILKVHQQLTDATGGKLIVPLLWRIFRTMITVHPLGGCAMGNTHDQGVVDHRGEVFGYPGLYVCDGASVPYPLGRNPSMTIAAIAERSAALMMGD